MIDHSKYRSSFLIAKRSVLTSGGTVDYAIARGWRLMKSGPRAHAWGRLYCPAQARDGCILSVYSTPRVPENHARYIRRRVDACPHQVADGAEEGNP